MNSHFDSIEKLIVAEGLYIVAVDIHPELDMMLIILNTKAVLCQRLSSYKRLTTDNITALMQYELTDGGTGIYWPVLDEDLSLKGFLRDELRNIACTNKPVTA